MTCPSAEVVCCTRTVSRTLALLGVWTGKTDYSSLRLNSCPSPAFGNRPVRPPPWWGSYGTVLDCLGLGPSYRLSVHRTVAVGDCAFWSGLDSRFHHLAGTILRSWGSGLFGWSLETSVGSRFDSDWRMDAESQRNPCLVSCVLPWVGCEKSFLGKPEENKNERANWSLLATKVQNLVNCCSIALFMTTVRKTILEPMQYSMHTAKMFTKAQHFLWSNTFEGVSGYCIPVAEENISHC